MTGRVMFDSCVQGYHIYKEFRNPTIGDTLTAKPYFWNPHDPYVVVVPTADVTVVGHLPWRSYAHFSSSFPNLVLFLRPYTPGNALVFQLA